MQQKMREPTCYKNTQNTSLTADPYNLLEMDLQEPLESSSVFFFNQRHNAYLKSMKTKLRVQT